MNATLVSIVAVAGLLIGSSAVVHAQVGSNRHGVESAGHKTRGDGSVTTRHHRIDRDDVDGFGAGTTGFGERDSDDRLRNDRDDRMMDSDTRGIDKQ